jgi:hypothetical protein
VSFIAPVQLVLSNNNDFSLIICGDLIVANFFSIMTCLVYLVSLPSVTVYLNNLYSFTFFLFLFSFNSIIQVSCLIFFYNNAFQIFKSTAVAVSCDLYHPTLEMGFHILLYSRSQKFISLMIIIFFTRPITQKL